ncbi:hypothetical protein [Massilia sp. PWRC2]|uniref:hypothetical protein n=1 Tax=Massilia sp. PWRC2 TaxID=2804626 RepID=UPI003CF590F3
MRKLFASLFAGLPGCPPGAALRLGVTANAIALVETRRWQRDARVLAELALDPALALPAALLAAAGSLFDTVRRDGWPLTVVLADDLVRLWHVTPPAGCSRLADLQAAAALRFQQLYGEPAASWQLSADWQLDRPFLAAAAPRPLLASVQQAGAAHAMTVLEVAPQFVVMLNRWRASLAPGDWFGVVHDGVLTLGVCDGNGGGALLALRALASGAHPNGAALREQVAREALRLNLPAPARLRLCGSVPPAWHAVDGCTVLGAAAGSAPEASPALQLAGCGSLS